MHKAFPLPGIEFPLAEDVPTASEEGCHCQKKREATTRKIALLSKSKRNYQSKSNDNFTKSAKTQFRSIFVVLQGESLSIHITFSFHTHQEMDQQYPTVAKIPILDIVKLEQWQFQIQQYLQHEHYALWEVIEFGDSYEVPASATITDTTSGETEIEQDDLNKKFLTSLAPEWRMHTIVWRNMSDLDTMSLDDFYNHLKVYESKVQKKLELNSQNMAFISSAKHSSGNKDGNTACVPTASTNVPTASASVATISHDTACAYIASQSSSLQIKFEDINQIDEDDMEEMDIKCNMALLSMRANKFWKKTGKKISIQGLDVAGFDKSKVECFNCHKMGHFARECRAPRSQDRGRRDTYRQGSKAEEQALKALMAIDGVGWDWSYMENDEEDHALVAGEEASIEFALMANTSTESKKLEILKIENEGVDGKLAGFLTASKDLDNLIESQRADKNKDGLGYSVVPPPPAQIYSSPKIQYTIRNGSTKSHPCQNTNPGHRKIRAMAVLDTTISST
nr:hypothetical protein [Tanacetum cinerariifolium]